VVDGVKWPGVTLAVAPSDRQRCDQPLYVAHSRFHRTGTLVGESRGRDLVSGSVLGRPGLAWSIVGDVCPETSRRLGGMRSLATISTIRRARWTITYKLRLPMPLNVWRDWPPGTPINNTRLACLVPAEIDWC
jgi:hypothetical protein